jgi:scyllo-inositol 2-dehydrogenase (NADP+)
VSSEPVAPLRLALIGYGLAGRHFHGPLIRATPGLAVTAIVVRDAARREHAAVDFPAAHLWPSPDAVWARRDDFDLVVVATPPGSHAQLAAAAIDARLALVVEKPLASNADAARALVDRAEAAGVLMVPFHNRRWDSDQMTLRALIAEHTLGDVYRYESRFERWRPRPDPAAWREATAAAEGGGILLDLGVHLVDQAICLFGPPHRVYGEVAARRGGADDDVFIALHHRSGTVSHLWAGALSAAPGPRLRVLGSEAAYVVQHLDGQEAALRGADATAADFGMEPPARWGRLVRGESEETVRSEPGRWRDFYPAVERALRTGAPPPVMGGDAVRALEVLDAARRSAHQRGSPAPLRPATLQFDDA